MSDPAVTVVITVYNGERYLAEAIESALDQSYPETDVLVVDDGSWDRTPEILRSYEDRITVVRQSNQGVARARNAGVQAANGHFVAFLDADDVWLPSKLEKQARALQDSPQAVGALCGYAIVDHHLHVRYAVPVGDPARRIRRVLALDAWGVAFASTAVVRRDTVLGVGGFDPGYTTSADVELLCRLVREGPMVGVQEILAFYRLHEGQMHRDWGQAASERRALFDNPLSPMTPEERERGRANLAVRMAYRSLLAGEFRGATAYAVDSLGRGPMRLLLAPLGAISRRGRYWVHGRTAPPPPARRRAGPSGGLW